VHTVATLQRHEIPYIEFDCTFVDSSAPTAPRDPATAGDSGGDVAAIQREIEEGLRARVANDTLTSNHDDEARGARPNNRDGRLTLPLDWRSLPIRCCGLLVVIEIR